MKMVRILTLFVSSLILLSNYSCSTHFIIDKKDLEKYIIKDYNNSVFKYRNDAVIKLKDNSFIFVKDFIINNSKMDTRKVRKEKFTGRQSFKRKKHNYFYENTINNTIELNNIIRITFNNRTRGSLEGLFGGTVAGLLGIIVTKPSATTYQPYAVLFGPILAGTITGFVKGHNTHYSFFSDNGIYKYQELREKNSNFYKVGIGLQSQKELPVGFLFGLGHAFDINNIACDLSYLNTTFRKNRSEFKLVNDFEFINIGYKYYFSINKKNSYYFGNNFSYGITYFENLDKSDLDKEFVYGENLGFKTSISTGYDFFIKDNRSFIDFTIHFPLQHGKATKIIYIHNGADAVEEKITGGNYWFPTFSLTLGFAI